MNDISTTRKQSINLPPNRGHGSYSSSPELHRSAATESPDVAAGRRRRNMSPVDNPPLRINASVKRARAVTLREPKSRDFDSYY